jgi:hypothetical protein
LRLRELRVQAEQRARDAELAKVAQEKLIQEGDAMNKLEIKKRLRELKMYRKAEIAPKPKVPLAPMVKTPTGPVLLVPSGSAQ